MSSSEIAIRVSNLSKCYQIYEKPGDRLMQFVMPRLRRFFGLPIKNYFREFWAINDVSFEVRKGETLGIIGRNGSGKSTLLQMICGTLTPTHGSVETNGRVAALLELGSGFNSEFTGRENVYLNASVLGLSKEVVNAKFDDIVAFADIGDFIEQPVKTYSSGMMVRLAFAVIAHVDANILVIDEALAVGDVFFQQKCMSYLRNYQNHGGTIVFVSHDPASVVGLCNIALLLRRDFKFVIGNAQQISQLYIQNNYSQKSVLCFSPKEESLISLRNDFKNELLDDGKITYSGISQPEVLFEITPYRLVAESFGIGGAEIADVWFESNDGSKLYSFKGEQLINFCIKIESSRHIQYLALGFMLKDRLGQYVIAEGSDLAFRQRPISMSPGEVVEAKFRFIMPILAKGEYTFNVAVADGAGDDHIQLHWVNDALLLNCIQSRLVHGISGVNNISVTIQKWKLNSESSI